MRSDQKDIKCDFNLIFNKEAKQTLIIIIIILKYIIFFINIFIIENKQEFLH